MRVFPIAGLVLLGACGFDGIPGLGGGDDPVDAAPDATDAFQMMGQLDAPIDGPPALALCDPGRGDLVACFEFENNADDAIGDVGATTVIGTPAFITGIAGQAIAFDGDDNLSLGPDTDLEVTNLTIDGWVNMLAPGSGRAGVLDSDGNFGLFIFPGGELRCSAASDGLTSLDTATTLTDGTWHHIACRYTPGRGSELFIDGDIVACNDSSDAIGTNATATTIGANSPTNNDQLVGALDSLRLWDDELSEGELCAAAGKTDCMVIAADCNL